MRELVFLINGNLNQKNVFMKNTNSYFKPLVLLFLLSVIPSWGFAQSIRVQGVVNDNASESIIGANVTEKGTTNGVITDLDGKFSLSVQKGATLVISYIGYVTQEIPVENETELKVILKEDSKALEEVVVIGSGTTRQRWECMSRKIRLDWRVVILRYTDMFSTPIHRLTHLDWIVTK